MIASATASFFRSPICAAASSPSVAARWRRMRSRKYLNSPETPLFHKGDNLYNHGPARQAAHNGAQLVVVEGYVDVIALVAAGFPAAVAPLGTALTENQLALLWRITDEPMLCFDGDRAGQKAAYRAATSRCRISSPERVCALRCCRKGRTRMTSRAAAAAARSKMCSPPHARSPT